MVAIALRFPAGRYHATPWGRHVNEADVEWPPSPWRLVRALIATWHLKADGRVHPESALESLIHKLCETLPVYRLPAATASHTRHYMPVRSGNTEKKVMIFDSFVRVASSEDLIVAWPELALEEDERSLLVALLRDTGFVGRSESWVEARVIDQWDGDYDCAPGDNELNPETGEIREPVRLLGSMSKNDYIAWRENRWNDIDWQRLRPRSRAELEATLPERLIDALRVQTGDLRRSGWSQPPGGLFITYRRPFNCLAPRRGPSLRLVRRDTTATTIRFIVAGKPRPRMQDAIKIGELLRMAVMAKAKKAFGENAIPPELSGHNLPTRDHSHAFYLPEDTDGDGRIDHILVHAPGGLSREAVESCGLLSKLFTGGREWPILMENYGIVDTFKTCPYLGSGKIWVSVTPYLHPWHRKKNMDVVDQIARECASRKGLPALEDCSDVPFVEVRGRRLRPVHFYRFRRRHGLPQPDRQGSFWRLTFSEPISGPLALGFGCHFGLGLFRLAEPSARGRV